MKAITAELVSGFVPQLAADANKYTRGMCELVVGQEAYAGAAVLAVRAASCMGAGYVRAYTCPQAAAALRVVQPSAVAQDFPEFAKRRHEASAEKPAAVVVGCGFDGGNQAAKLVFDVLSRSKAPVLVDGGGLAVLASDEGRAMLCERADQGYVTVVTPHAGEAAKLIDSLLMDDGSRTAMSALTVITSAANTETDFQQAANAWFIAHAFKVTCVLKGPRTYIADTQTPDMKGVLELSCGTPALAKAGTGDVLAGAIGSLLATGMPATQACALGTYIHAQAGVLAAQQTCALCVTTEDVLESLPQAMVKLLG